MQKLLSASLSFFVFCINLHSAEEPSIEAIRGFVINVLQGTPYNNRGEPVAHRWTKSPVVSTFDADKEQQAWVHNVIAQINSALNASPITMQEGKPQNEAAEIEIHFLPKRQFGEFARKRKFVFHGGKIFADVWADYDPDQSLRKVHIILPTDEEKRNYLKHYVLGTVFGSMGFLNGVSLIEGGFTQTELTPLDKKLVEFLYLYIDSGFNAEQVGKAFDTHWSR